MLEGMLQNHAVIITGASGFLGRALAVGFSNASANLVLHGRNEANLKKTKSQCRQKANVEILSGDLTDDGAAEKLAGFCMDKFGKIDSCVLNSGILHDQLVMGIDLRNMESVLKVNYLSQFSLLQSVIKRMVVQKNGSIIGISSTSSMLSPVGQVAYSSSKAAMETMFITAAKECAPKGVRVNCIAPGLLTGGMAASINENYPNEIKRLIPMGRAGKPEEVVPLALFLASRYSSYITGQVVKVDGGLTA